LYARDVITGKTFASFQIMLYIDETQHKNSNKTQTRVAISRLAPFNYRKVVM